MRTIIDLPDDQIKALGLISEKEHLSRAELIRRAVSSYLKKQQDIPQDEAFGLWKNRKQDGLNYQRQIRKDWQE